MQESSTLYSESKIFKLGNNQDIRYVDTQDGTSILVFIHGMGSNLDNWCKLIEPLSKDYRCILIDLPGYGWSTPFPESFTLRSCVKVIHQLLFHLEIYECTIVAHSMGGQIGILFAQDTKIRINELVLIAPAGLEQFNEDDLKWIVENITVEFLKLMDKGAVTQMVRKNFYNKDINIERILRPRLAVMDDPIFYHTYCTTIVESYQAMLKEKTIIGKTKISIPVSIFFGLEDYFIPHRILHKNMSLAKVVEMADLLFTDYQHTFLIDCGHFPQWEKPEKILTHFNTS